MYANGEIEDLDEGPRRRLRINDSGVIYVSIAINASIDILPMLSPLQTKIVMILLADYRDGEPWARMTAAEIGREAGVVSQALYRALTPLVDAQVIFKINRTTWRVNPRLGWRGSRKQWDVQYKQAPLIRPEKLKAKR